ncbi:hypothetical protein WMY93_001062 [Mugilogobius chulae]|uniref:DBIRD complex subunit ZNF326 n=1 Tax=Mugilogobius chulae TaxID=88201 RepID=A0AAW0QG02_9GOBI
MYRPNNPRFTAQSAANSGQNFVPIGPRRGQGNFRNVPPPQSLVSKDAIKCKSKPRKRPSSRKQFGPENNKWKSSFTTLDNDGNDTKDSGSSPDGSKQRSHLYNLFNPIKSDADEHSLLESPDDTQKYHSRWDIDESTWNRESCPGSPQLSIRDDKPAERASYSSGSILTEHRETEHRAVDYAPELSAPQRLPPPLQSLPPPLPQHLPPPQHLTAPPLHRPPRLQLVPPPTPQHLPPAQHLSAPPPQQPPPLPSQRNYKQLTGFSDLDPLPPSRPESKNPSKNEIQNDKNLISCDLCEVRLSNGQELEEHLDSKTHWDTLEYIQKHNNYDDMVIAFLQDVMLYKSHKSSRAIEDTALPALQEYDHMTKVEMFQCAACNVLVPTCASAVQNHITTQGHITNTKEFETRQRQLCLEKASTMMKELMPQFQSFVKGVSPFE